MFLLFGILLLLPLVSAAQIKIDVRKVEKINFSGMAFSTLPFSKSAKKTSTNSKIKIEDSEILEKTFALGPPVFVSTELCGDVNGISVPFDDGSFIYRVQRYYSYEFAGKTFAYQVEYEFFDADTGDEVGATTAAFYVDEIGSGTFGISCVKDFKLDRLPVWVKNLASK